MFSPSLPGSCAGIDAPADGEGPARAPGALPAVARMADRAFPGSVLLLYTVGRHPMLLSWTRSGLHPSPYASDAPLLELCAAASEAAGPLLVPRVPRVGWSVAGALDVGFAGTVLEDGGSGDVLALLLEADRCWTSDELEWLTDLAAAGGAERRREREARASAGLSEALERSEQRYDRLLSTYPSAIFGIDRMGRIIDPNPAAAEIVERTLEELRGVPLETLVAPEDVEEARAAFSRASSGGEGRNEIELRLIRPSGERRLVHIVCMASEEDGRVVWLQGMARDITEERAREMQLRQAARMATVGPLLSGVCHELNNPLTSIRSFAELLLLDERSDEDREALEIVQREAARAAQIVSDLRIVARQSQEADSGQSTVRLEEVVRHVLELRGEALAGQGIEVVVDVAPDMPPVLGVPAHLEQVVGQLVRNAEQAMRAQTAHRRLLVRVHRGDLGTAVQVVDTGPGIEPEHLERIFDPFWTTRRAGEGTGLGLSLVSSIISEHGGRVWVDSQPGRGAAFTVDLPLSENPPMALGTCENGPAIRRLRILVVDDEAPIRFSLSRYLERRGHAVEEAAEGGAALKLLDEAADGRRYDIIVADLRMPGLNGEQLLASLRERKDGMDSRLIFITGDAEAPDVEEMLRDAEVPVVWKPFELAEVAQIIEAQAGMTVA